MPCIGLESCSPISGKCLNLGHIEFVDPCAPLPDPPSCDDGDAVVVVMENLHTLKGIRNFKCSEEVVKRIPNIKKLKLEYGSCYHDDHRDRGDAYLTGNMKYLCGLEVLNNTIFRHNAKLSAGGGLITFPHSLKKLSLCFHKNFEWDDVMLEKIGSLPLLEKLKLSMGHFEREEWEIGEGQFPSLKYLEIKNCSGLKNLRKASESILPRLEHLKLVGLDGLMEIPFELGNIDTLKVIEVIRCGERAVRSLKEMFDEQVELAGGEDQLSFHVLVQVYEWENLLSLASPKFYVKLL